MRSKRFVAVAASAAVLCVGAAACGSSSGTGAGSKSAVMVISTLSNPFFVSLKNGAQAEAKKDGYSLDIQNANNSDSTELNYVQTDLVKKPGVLILDPTSSEAASAAVKQANAAKVPVVAFDRQPTSGSLKAFVGYNAVAAGERAGNALAAAVGDKGDVVEIEGILGTNVAQDRHKGFRQAMAKYPNIHIVATQSANFDQATALDVMTNILQAHPDIQGVYAANDEMALGVLSALQARHLSDVKVVGNDGIEQALAAIQSGTLTADNAESAYAEGQRVADLANDVLQGKPISQASQTLEGTLVTKANLAAYCKHLVSIGDSADVPPSLR